MRRQQPSNVEDRSMSWQLSYRLWPHFGQGAWIRNIEQCQKQQPSTQSLCLMSRYEWKLPGLTMFSPQQACEILRKRSITNIYLSGDSLIRHVSLGMLMVLTDEGYSNFPPFSIIKCDRNSLFYEKTQCRVDQFEVPVCNNFTTIRWQVTKSTRER